MGCFMFSHVFPPKLFLNLNTRPVLGLQSTCWLMAHQNTTTWHTHQGPPTTRFCFGGQIFWKWFIQWPMFEPCFFETRKSAPEQFFDYFGFQAGFKHCGPRSPKSLEVVCTIWVCTLYLTEAPWRQLSFRRPTSIIPWGSLHITSIHKYIYLYIYVCKYI